jgi:DNA polymerase I-like protein with 3'-5' exonuclease and polymerase domains
MARVLDSANLPVLSPADSGRVYNALDAALTFEIASKQEMTEVQQASYNFVFGMQGPALTLMRRGILIDQDKRQEVYDRLSRKYDFLLAVFQDITEEVCGRRIAVNSHPQIKDLFYKYMKIPEIKVFDYSTKKKKVSVGREALEEIQAYYWAAPIAKIILAIRDLGKKLNVVKSGVSSDGRMRCSYSVAGTETGRWSSSKNVWGGGCLLPTAQVLTPTGWKEISRVKSGDLIAQWEQSGRITYVSAEPFETDYDSMMLRVQGEQIYQTLTALHRVPHWDARKAHFNVRSALEVSENAQVNLPISGSLIGGQLEFPRFLAMLLADASFEGSGWRVSFKKQRKIDRFIWLMQSAGVPFSEQKAAEGYRRFYISGFKDLPRAWGEWVLALTPACAEALIDEAQHWDGTARGASYVFYTASAREADWIQTLAHIAGRGATIHGHEQSAGSYSDTFMFRVNVKPRKVVNVLRKHWSSFSYTGKVHCVTVPSGFFLMRENGFISVTGNTNNQNITDEMREMFVADPGMKLAYLDLEQAESKVVALISGDPRYIEACSAGDLHTYVCKLVWPNLPWANEPKADKAVAEQIFYRHFTYRDMAKRGGHAKNYYAKNPTIAHHLKLSRQVAEDFGSGYYRAFPGIPAWHMRVAQRLASKHELTTILGRQRFFFGRWTDDSTIRKAIAFEPQSVVGEILNLGLYRIWRSLDRVFGGPVEILGQIHDAVLLQYPEELELEILPQALGLMRVQVPTPSGILDIPTEASVGWNWRKKTKGRDGQIINPWGLQKFDGTPERRSRPERREIASLLDRLIRSGD